MNEGWAGGKPANQRKMRKELLGKGSELGKNQWNRVKTGKLFGKGSELGENQRTGGKPVMTAWKRQLSCLEKVASWGKTSKLEENQWMRGCWGWKLYEQGWLQSCWKPRDERWRGDKKNVCCIFKVGKGRWKVLGTPRSSPIRKNGLKRKQWSCEGSKSRCWWCQVAAGPITCSKQGGDERTKGKQVCIRGSTGWRIIKRKEKRGQQKSHQCIYMYK